MSKIDLHLIGNSTVDQIFKVQKSEFGGKGFIPGGCNTYTSVKTQYGSIGNFLSIFKKTDLKVIVSTHIGKDVLGEKIINYFSANNFELDPYKIKETSSAIILSETVDTITGALPKKTSFVKWGNVHDFKNFKPHKATWAHISYLDILHNLDLSKLRKHYDYISADLCLHAPKKSIVKKVVSNLKYLDFLFMSTDECKSYYDLVAFKSGRLEISETLTELLNINKSNARIILHSPHFCTICGRSEKPLSFDGFETLKTESAIIGAGDKFCASFIHRALELKESDKSKYYFVGKEIRRPGFIELIISAHKNTRRVLSKNEEL